MLLFEPAVTARQISTRGLGPALLQPVLRSSPLTSFFMLFPDVTVRHGDKVPRFEIFECFTRPLGLAAKGRGPKFSNDVSSVNVQCPHVTWCDEIEGLLLDVYAQAEAPTGSAYSIRARWGLVSMVSGPQRGRKRPNASASLPPDGCPVSTRGFLALYHGFQALASFDLRTRFSALVNYPRERVRPGLTRSLPFFSRKHCSFIFLGPKTRVWRCSDRHTSLTFLLSFLHATYLVSTAVFKTAVESKGN